MSTIDNDRSVQRKRRRGDGDGDAEGDADAKADAKVEKLVLRTNDPTEAQRVKLENLFRRIEKPINLPNPAPSELRPLRPPPEFVRNIPGSSAGAGSGEFHIYRHLRRKEMARVERMDEEARKEYLDQQYAERQAFLRSQDEERTAKRRAKRKKRKQGGGGKGGEGSGQGQGVPSDAEGSDESEGDGDIKGDKEKKNAAGAGPEGSKDASMPDVDANPDETVEGPSLPSSYTSQSAGQSTVESGGPDDAKRTADLRDSSNQAPDVGPVLTEPAPVVQQPVRTTARFKPIKVVEEEPEW
ncbi:DUF1168-domain-containing protein [Gonapodya prolifera JEL478]|uniref:DUF1168-domain-containing protein n=1 Tax=Gonapodya prolifera (strain JEL478) TaxID=1344416 RepID=A0A139A1S2_GONPJ|nr:DUF1168-domain-containing protein [Gonapodya prolifera JEL478]|eukprot:KXS10712.1 DUF1168-domain-containing protein [Gonapodya prolifera JEL478]